MSNMMQATSGGTSVELARRPSAAWSPTTRSRPIVMNFDSRAACRTASMNFRRRFSTRAASKPIVAQVDSAAPAPRYWLATGATRSSSRQADRSDRSASSRFTKKCRRLLEQEGVTYTLISSGGIKGKNNDFMPLTEECAPRWRSRVAYVDGLFVKALARNRGICAVGRDGSIRPRRNVSPKAALVAGWSTASRR
jgi:hypothetical protein